MIVFPACHTWQSQFQRKCVASSQILKALERQQAAPNKYLFVSYELNFSIFNPPKKWWIVNEETSRWQSIKVMHLTFIWNWYWSFPQVKKLQHHSDYQQSRYICYLNSNSVHLDELTRNQSCNLWKGERKKRLERRPLYFFNDSSHSTFSTFSADSNAEDDHSQKRRLIKLISR